MSSCNQIDGALDELLRRIKDVEAKQQQCCDQARNQANALDGRVRALENGGINGNNGNNQDLVEKVFKDRRWLAAVGILGMVTTGRAGITNINSLQAPAARTFDKLSKAVDIPKLNQEVERFRQKYIERLNQRLLGAENKASKAIRDSKGALDKAKETFDKAKEGFEKVDKGFSRLTRGLDKYVAAAGLGFGIAGVIISFAALWQSEANQAAFDRQVDRFQVDLSRQLGFLQQLKSRIDNFKQEADRRFRILEREADLVSQHLQRLQKLAEAAKKQANDITYEARTRLQRLNDNLYVVSQRAQRLNDGLAVAKTDINRLKSADTATGNRLRTVESKAQQASQQAQSANNKATQAQSQIRTIDQRSQQANNTANSLKAQLPVVQQLARSGNDIARAVQVKAGQIEATVRGIQQQLNRPQPQQVTPQQVQQEVTRQIGVQSQRFEQQQATINRQMAGIEATNRAVAVQAQQATVQTTSNAALQQQLATRVAQLQGQIPAAAQAAVQAQLQPIREQLANPPISPAVQEHINRLNRELQGNNAVNQEANRKLDNVITLLGAMPAAVVARATPTINGAAEGVTRSLEPQITRLPDATATAVAAAPCNARGCGGRTAQRVDGIADEVAGLRQQMNAMPDRLGAVNATMNAGQLAILQRIDSTTQGITNKLGPLLSGGGIAGYLQRMTRWMHIDKVMQAMSLLTSVHNAYMLSSSLGQTLFSATSNVMAAFGIKDMEGNPIDVGQVLGTAFDDAMKSALGVQTWDGIKTQWKAYNRIYQAASNLMFSVQSMVYNIQDSMSVVGSWIAQMGNGMRKDGVASENAWRWFNPQPNFKNPFFNAMERLENLEEVTSQIDQVASNVLSVQQTATEIVKQKAELDKAIAEVDGSKQGTTPPDAAKVKAASEAQKAVSQSVAIPVAAESSGGS